MHSFQTHLVWTPGQNKSHTVHIAQKADLFLSAAKAFKGDAQRYNPEDLLLSSVSSCHMMSFLYVCQKKGLELLQYEDRAQAFLEVYADGSGKITQVILKPDVTWAKEVSKEEEGRLHQEAHRLCFIANSCQFPIEIQYENLNH